MKDKNKTLTSSEKIAAKTEGFFARNYRLLIIILVLIVVACVGVWIGTVIVGQLQLLLDGS